MGKRTLQIIPEIKRRIGYCIGAIFFHFYDKHVELLHVIVRGLDEQNVIKFNV